MATKKSSKRSSAKSYRAYTADRSSAINAMVKDLQRSKDKADAFLANPAVVARDYGVKLSREEESAIKFVSGVSLVSALGRLKKPGVAVFDHNCSCPGPGPSCW